VGLSRATRQCTSTLPQHDLLVYISDHSNAEITQYADFHGRNAKLKIMHKTKIKDEREPEIK